MILPHNTQYITKKYLFDLLQEKYEPNERMIDRLAHYLTSEQDMKDFVQIFLDSFEKGYTKAINDYKDQLRKLGYEVRNV